jgi:hypothetical protein
MPPALDRLVHCPCRRGIGGGVFTTFNLPFLTEFNISVGVFRAVRQAEKCKYSGTPVLVPIYQGTKEEKLPVFLLDSY